MLFEGQISRSLFGANQIFTESQIFYDISWANDTEELEVAHTGLISYI